MDDKNYVEMFAGLGGMGYGLTQAGWKCVGYAEWDKFAHRSYEILHDPNRRMWNRYNVRYVSNRSLRKLRRKRGSIRLLAAGFPCQSFSIAGKRKGFKDRTRGTLFFEVVRWASILEPEYLLLENVEGLLNHDNGATFEIILGALDELGYDAEWQVLNSSAYVPQNRERIFIVGHLRGTSGRKIFPFGAENTNAIEVVGRIEGNHDQNSRVYGITGIAPTLSTMQGGGQEPKVLVNEVQCINPRKEDGTQTYQQDRVYDTYGVMTALSAQLAGRFNIIEPRAVLTPDREEKRQQGRRFKEPGEPAFTVNTIDRHGVAIPNENSYRIRKLTPLECFRLQSFPDEWYYKLKEHGISDSQLYKMAGNAVTSVVAYEIGRRLIG